MTDADKELVRKWWGILMGAHCDDLKRILNLLVEQAARADRAEHDLSSFCKHKRLPKDELGYRSRVCIDWTDTEWIAAKRKEWGIL